MSKLETAQELREIGKYEAGRADTCSTMIDLFKTTLPENIMQWLYDERLARRTNSAEAYENIIKILKGGL